jgi:hypothetical protein
MGSRHLVLCVLAMAAAVAVSSAANARTVVYDVRAFIDDHDQLIVQGGSLYWHHDTGAAVGRWEGHNEATIISSSVDETTIMEAVEWVPDWPRPYPDEIREPADSSLFTSLSPPLPAEVTGVTVQMLEGRDEVAVTQMPEAANDNTLIVDFWDRVPEAVWYEAQITVEWSGPFVDVATDFWAAAQIEACVTAGVVRGYDDGTYQPTLSVTRDQMAVYIARALAGGDSGVPEYMGTADFSDVGLDYWAAKYIYSIRDENIVTGYEDGTYQPTRVVTRDQMAVYIARAVATPHGDEGLASYEPPDAPSFSDVPADSWAYRYVEYAKSQDIVSGYTDGTYQPDAAVTRDQMAVYIARAFALQ